MGGHRTLEVGRRSIGVAPPAPFLYPAIGVIAGRHSLYFSTHRLAKPGQHAVEHIENVGTEDAEDAAGVSYT